MTLKLLLLVRKVEKWLAIKAGERYPYQSYSQIKTSLDEKEKVLASYHRSFADGP